jgi:hypothetical protein
MDAYLSREAFRSLRILSLILSGSNPDGLLIGHKRGHRFFVEKIFPSRPGFFPSLKACFQLEQIFEGSLLGFFSFKPDQKKIKKLLAPLSQGKLFLEIRSGRKKRLMMKSFVIDYEKKFFLAPIKLKFSK